MIRLVLFDIDGTLIRTNGASVRAFREVFASEFGATNRFGRLKFAGRTDFSLVREFFDDHGIAASEENFDRFFARYGFWLDHILPLSNTEICAGAIEFIRDLKALPRPPLVGLLTGNVRLGAEIKLRHVNLWDEFETGAFGDDSEDRCEIASIAFERAGRVMGEPLNGDEVLVIGDTPFDIQCGRAIGAKVLAVASGGASSEELSRHQPDWLVDDLTQRSAVSEISSHLDCEL